MMFKKMMAHVDIFLKKLDIKAQEKKKQTLAEALAKLDENALFRALESVMRGRFDIYVVYGLSKPEPETVRPREFIQALKEVKGAQATADFLVDKNVLWMAVSQKNQFILHDTIKGCELLTYQLLELGPRKDEMPLIKMIMADEGKVLKALIDHQEQPGCLEPHAQNEKEATIQMNAKALHHSLYPFSSLTAWNEIMCAMRRISFSEEAVTRLAYDVDYAPIPAQLVCYKELDKYISFLSLIEDVHGPRARENVFISSQFDGGRLMFQGHSKMGACPVHARKIADQKLFGTMNREMPFCPKALAMLSRVKEKGAS